MLCNQKLASSAGSEQLNSYKNRSDYHSMKPVDSQGIDWMKTRQEFTSWRAKRHVSADLRHRATRFESSHEIWSGQVLVLKAYVRLCEDPKLVETAEHVSRQRKPSSCEHVLLLNHPGSAHAERQAGMGQPTARRIISFVQPAQQMYFRGSSTETAKLSPLRFLPGLGARRALRHVIPTDPPNLANMIEDTELATRTANERLSGRASLCSELRWHNLAGYKTSQLFLAHFSQPAQVRHLFS
jgi:hypothetical protein